MGPSWWISEFALPRFTTPAVGPAPAVPLPQRRSVGLEHLAGSAVDLALAGGGQNLDRWVLEICGNVGEGLWNDARRSREGYGAGCQDLADLSAEIRSLQQAAHDSVGAALGWAVERSGADQFTATVVARVARRLPLPWDQQLTAVVHAIHVVGILVCIVDDRPLTSCACLNQVITPVIGAMAGRIAHDTIAVSLFDVTRSAPR